MHFVMGEQNSYILESLITFNGDNMRKSDKLYKENHREELAFKQDLKIRNTERIKTMFTDQKSFNKLVK